MFTTVPPFAVRQAHCLNYMQAQPVARAEPHEQGSFVNHKVSPRDVREASASSRVALAAVALIGAA